MGLDWKKHQLGQASLAFKMFLLWRNSHQSLWLPETQGVGGNKTVKHSFVWGVHVVRGRLFLLGLTERSQACLESSETTSRSEKQEQGWAAGQLGQQSTELWKLARCVHKEYPWLLSSDFTSVPMRNKKNVILFSNQKTDHKHLTSLDSITINLILNVLLNL